MHYYCLTKKYANKFHSKESLIPVMINFFKCENFFECLNLIEIPRFKNQILKKDNVYTKNSSKHTPLTQRPRIPMRKEITLQSTSLRIIELVM